MRLDNSGAPEDQAGRQLTPESHVIRPAVPGDHSHAVELIYLPMGSLADYLFGFGNADRAKVTLRYLFQQKGNRFSYEFADLLEIDREPAGLLLSYPSDALPGMQLPMARDLWRCFGILGMARFLWRCLPLMRIKETEPREFYIYTLAISPKYQHHGLGKELVRFAENKARGLGLPKLSLGVTQDNEAAIQFYDDTGFKRVGSIKAPALERKIGYQGVYRMVKKVTLSKGSSAPGATLSVRLIP